MAEIIAIIGLLVAVFTLWRWQKAHQRALIIIAVQHNALVELLKKKDIDLTDTEARLLKIRRVK